MQTEIISYADDRMEYEGYAAFDDAERDRRPGVLIFHAWAGQDAFARLQAEKLAALGYVGFAVDMYGKGRRGNSTEENAALMQPLVQDRALLLSRAQAALNTLRHHPRVDRHRIAAIGFCFGGLCAMDVARAGLEGVRSVVSFHGLLGAPSGVTAGAKPLHTKILALHGWNDPMAKPADVLAWAKELTDSGCDWTLEAYGHRGHAFTNPQATDAAGGMQFCPLANRRAFAAMEDFLRETLAESPAASWAKCPVPG
ncbi:MAG: dienelactone hydrolase family protein [Planctomycetes bacterium]|nr:dienelactone hydrolase family protein [Planctomycetota bacterium]